jgi:hypothetical protein
MKFALITEGPSEHRIIKYIVTKYFKDHDPEINQIQPKLIDGKQDNKTPGGWNEVLKYCGREELKDIFVENDYLIIQIDTDQSQLLPFNISHIHPDNKQKSTEELCNEVVENLRGRVLQEVKEKYGDKIFFAICVHTIECWLLPLFYSDKHINKTLNCLKTLNAAFRKNDIHIITSENKNEPNGIKSYETALKKWKRKQDINNTAKHNAGFKNFVDSLNAIKVNET